jgi:hypothetical protein
VFKPHPLVEYEKEKKKKNISKLTDHSNCRTTKLLRDANVCRIRIHNWDILMQHKRDLKIKYSTTSKLKYNNLIHHLRNPEPDLLNDVSRNLFRPLPILSIQSCLAGGDIGIMRGDPVRSLQNLPKGIQAKEDWDTDISSKEV